MSDFAVSALSNLDLISFLKAIPDPRMHHGVRIPSWYLLLIAILGIPSQYNSLRDLERFAEYYHAILTESLGIQLRRYPSDSAFRYFFQQVDLPALCAAIRYWLIAQIPGCTQGLELLVCDRNTLRGSIESTANGGSAFIALVTLYSPALGMAINSSRSSCTARLRASSKASGTSPSPHRITR